MIMSASSVLEVNSRNNFCIEAGIRQGCPISPLLFALVSDVFIRALESALPLDAVRACADDIALVTLDIRVSFWNHCSSLLGVRSCLRAIP